MKKIYYLLVFILVFASGTSNAQSKKWTLEECVEYALKNNITIKQTELDIKSTAIDKKAAFGSFLPTVNANASHSWNIGLNQNITTGLLENQTTQFTSAGLNSGIDIYNGLQNQNRYRRAKLAIVAAQYQLDKMKDDVSLNVANAFLQILFNKENIKVQKEQLSNDEKQFARTQELVNVGTIPRGDLLDVKATVAADKQRVVAAENNLYLSKLSLAQLLQLENFQEFDVAETNYEAKPSEVMVQKPEDILAKAKEERVELKIAKTNLELAEKDVTIAKGAFMPSVSGFYSFSTRASYSDRIVGVDGSGNPIFSGPLPLFDQFSNNKGHNFGVQLNIPIFNGFVVKNNVERSKISLERTKISKQQSELDLERNVYTAIIDAKGALNSYESAVTALEARQEAYNYAKERYAVGIMNAFDINQAQTLFVNAQSEVLRTKYDYIFKVKVVEFYFGIPISKIK
ncbi:TolC family protein [Flavobacterium sp.]|uniref:TolC family protein n=1 Tax=Flavobacterium sp. TaxID=239 RepID=UPI003753902E